MKRLILYALILTGVLMIPLEKLDVGKLEPVQAVWVSKQGHEILMETDTEDKGSGETMEDALADLEERCLGIIYLDTAQFLLVSEDTTEQIPKLRDHLKGSVMVCQWDGQGSVEDAAKYMASHEEGYPIKDWNEGVKLPVLKLENAKIKNVEKK